LIVELILLTIVIVLPVYHLWRRINGCFHRVFIIYCRKICSINRDMVV